MKKAEKITLYISAAGIMTYIIRSMVNAFMDGFRSPLPDYFGLAYITPFGVILLLSIFCQIAVLMINIFRKRKLKGKKEVSGLYRISFYCSFIPFLLLLGYCVYCSEYGFRFLWGVYDGWSGFSGAFVIMGLIFCIIPVFPFCIFWQVFYITKWIIGRKKAKAAASAELS